MKSIRYMILLALVAVSAGALAGSTLLDRSFRPLAGKQPVDLAATYGGQVLLIVNTASKCGDAATPLYRDLAAVTGVAPGWNFHKYLVGRDGQVIANWGSRTTPDDAAIVAAIERALKAPKPKSR